MKNKTSKKTSDKKISRKTIFSLIAVVVVFAVVSIAMLPLIHLLSSEHGQQVIIDKMQSFGIFAPLLFVLLSVESCSDSGAVCFCPLPDFFWERFWCTIWCSGSADRW